MVQRQASFDFKGAGGARRGAGRKPSGPRGQVPHVARPQFPARHPLHVTWRVDSGPESLRRRRAFHVVRDALIAGADRFGTRIVHFNVLSNHVHLICEARDAAALSKTLRGLGVRIARGLNRLWGRVGPVVTDRYHARELKTPREVNNALNYVVDNARRHGFRFRGPDPCSSALWFDGCRATDASPLPPARPDFRRVLTDCSAAPVAAACASVPCAVRALAHYPISPRGGRVVAT